MLTFWKPLAGELIRTWHPYFPWCSSPEEARLVGQPLHQHLGMALMLGLQHTVIIYINHEDKKNLPGMIMLFFFVICVWAGGLLYNKLWNWNWFQAYDSHYLTCSYNSHVTPNLELMNAS